MTKAEPLRLRTAVPILMITMSAVIGVAGDRVGATSDLVTGATASSAPVTTETPPVDLDPEDSVAETIPDDSLPPEESLPPPAATGPTNDPVDPLTVVVALAGFAVLLGVAAWWMVRRVDPDAQPLPSSENDPDWPTDQMI
jgi:hypothetical protein